MPGTFLGPGDLDVVSLHILLWNIHPRLPLKFCSHITSSVEMSLTHPGRGIQAICLPPKFMDQMHTALIWHIINVCFGICFPH